MFKQWTFSILITFATFTAHADNYTYQSIFFNGNTLLPFPGLDLNQVTRANFELSDEHHTPERNLDSVKLDFEFAPSLYATNFRRVAPNRYVTTVKDAWAFSEVFVEVDSGSGFQYQDDIQVRISVVDFTSKLQHNDFPSGPELFMGNGPVQDISPRTVADTLTLTLDDKLVTLELMDRLGSNTFMPTPNYKEGFEIRANWQGKGTRTFFIQPNFNESEYANYRAIGFSLQTHPGPMGEEYFAQVLHNFNIPNPTPMESNPIHLNQVLREVYNQ